MDETVVKTGTDEAVLTIAFEGMYSMVDARVGVFVDGVPLPPGSLLRGFRYGVRLPQGSHEVTVKAGLRKVKYLVDLSPNNAYIMLLTYSRTWGNFDKAYELASMNWEEAVNSEPPVLDAACPEQDIRMLRREEWGLRWKTFSRTFALTGILFGLFMGLIHGSSVYGVLSGFLFGLYMGCFFAVLGVSSRSKWYRRQK